MAAVATFGKVKLIGRNQRPEHSLSLKGEAFNNASGWLFTTKITWKALLAYGQFDQPLQQSLQVINARQQPPEPGFVPEPLRAVPLREAQLCPARNRLWLDGLLIVGTAQQEQLARYMVSGKRGACFVQVVCDPSWDVPLLGKPGLLWSQEDSLLAYLMRHTRLFHRLDHYDYWTLRQFATALLSQNINRSLFASLIETWTPFVEGWEAGQITPEHLEGLLRVAQRALATSPKQWFGWLKQLEHSAPACVEEFDF